MVSVLVGSEPRSGEIFIDPRLTWNPIGAPYAFVVAKVRLQAMLPSSTLSKNQIDRLGDRLRKGDISEEDLRLLDSYRRSFTNAYEDVVGKIRDQLALEPTGRPAKSTTSIVDK